MKKIKFALKTIALLIIIYTSYWIFNTAVMAQTELPLMVMPARNYIEVSPGEKASLTVNFYNKSEDPITGIFKTADFIVSDKNGTPKLIDNVFDAPPKYSAASWFTLFYDRATLPVNDKVSLQTTIDVPSDAHPGGRYVAIFFEKGSNVPNSLGVQEQAGVGTTSRIASLIYIKVKGPITEKALVSRFFVPSFFEYGPVKVTTEILNRGDYHIAPKGTVTLTNMFNGVVDQQPLKEENIFPDASRTFENEVGAKYMAGRYRVDLSAIYGDQGQVLTSSVYVWVFPWRIVTAVILTVIIVIYIINSLYKNFVAKEGNLEKEISKEKEEIEKLRDQLRKRGV